MTNKLAIATEMAAFDHKDRNFYNSLTDEERKKFSNFMMIRWGSSIGGSTELQEYYLRNTNERLNKHFFTINKHPQLQWLCATSVSPGVGLQRHNWIGLQKKNAESNAIKKQLAELFPNMKLDDLELLAAITTKSELKEYLRELGIK